MVAMVMSIAREGAVQNRVEGERGAKGGTAMKGMV